MKSFYFLFIFFFIQKLIGQSLIINEFSNGPTGSQEYIEFIVVDPNFVQNCDGNPPPCVDIRGWIIDDNSGYHGAGGVAVGCNRFSFDPLWQCVPLGTIIVIYNNAEPNVNLPSDDISMSDNNCKLIIPINNSQLFESNSTTPGSVACSYPSSGWMAGGNWLNIGMRNGGDCVRLVNLSGCEVFSLCYADVNQNTQIYFNSGNSGTDNVWYFNNGDYNLQINWSEGCADPTSCGVNNQTPGLPNNTLNRSYIAQFNNNCQPILPVSVNAGNNVSGCANGTISLSGLAAGTYTSVAWSGGSGTFSSQNTVTSNYTLGNADAGSFMLYIDAFNLCGVPTRDSVEVTVLELSNIQISNDGPYCPSEAIQLNAPSGYTYSWSGPNSFISNLQNPTIAQANSLTAGTYSVLVVDPSTNCQNTFTTNVSINSLPIIDISSSSVQNNPASCGQNDGSVIGASASGTSPFNYYWTNSTGIVLSTISDLTSAATGIYNLVVTDANGCKDSVSVNIGSLNGPYAPTFQTVSSICEGGTQNFLVNNSISGATYTWSLGSTIVQTGIDLTSLSVSNFSSSNSGPYTVEVNSGGCSNFSTISGNVIPRPIPTITGNTAVCAGNTIQLDATSSLPLTGIQFQWYLNNSLIPNETNSTLSVNNSGNYQVLVSANGCDSISTAIQISVNSLPIIDSTNQILVQATCGLNNASVSSISVTGNSPFNYNWTNGLGVSFSNTIDLNNASDGQYYFVVTDANGCKDSIQYQLTSTPAPQTPILIAPNQVCEGSTFILNVNNADPNLNYSWNFNGNTIQSGIGLDSLVIISGTLQNAGTYEVIATNGICSADTFMVISVIEQPNPQIIASGLSFCSGNSVTLSVTNNINFNYQWFLGNQLIPGENNNSIDLNTGGNYQVLVSNNGCDSLSSSITITELASPLLIANSVSSCLNQPTQLTASGANSYSWIGTTGQFNTAIINIDSSQAGVYTFTLTGTSINGCTSDTVISATVFNSPTILINGIENDSISVCENDSIKLTASGGLNYLWSNLSTSDSIQLNLNQDTTIKVIGIDVNGCIDSSYVRINVKPLPVLSQILGTPTICNGYPTQLYLDTTYVNQNYTWINALGNTISPSDSVLINTPGIYSLVVSNECRNDTIPITIGQSSIQASFIADTTLGVAPLSINFTNTSSGATNYYWLLGNGDTTTVFSPSTIYNQPGTYVAYMLASNSSYCYSYFALQIIVLENNEIFPNVFSPNEDDLNDEFFIKGIGVKSLNCKIYNRWGNLVYELNQPDTKWKPGKEFPEGTYYYIAELKFINGLVLKKQGYILLVR